MAFGDIAVRSFGLRRFGEEAGAASALGGTPGGAAGERREEGRNSNSRGGEGRSRERQGFPHFAGYLRREAHRSAHRQQGARRTVGLWVDNVLGMAQTVIKPLDRAYDLFGHMKHDFVKPRSVNGAAILGDGNVGIILDVHGLETAAFGTS